MHIYKAITCSALSAEAMEKISALESELARLKAQIAVYALSEESNIPPGEYTYTSVLVEGYCASIVLVFNS